MKKILKGVDWTVAESEQTEQEELTPDGIESNIVQNENVEPQLNESSFRLDSDS